MGKEHVDHLPILATGLGVHKLLGVPKLVWETGENTAAAVYSALDTATASNIEAQSSTHSNSSLKDDPACNWEAVFHVIPDAFNCDFNDIYKDILM